MTFHSVLSKTLLLFCVICLAACGSLREDLGLGRNPPDEFLVMDRPPLIMPPDYAIKPPGTFADRSNEFSPERKAQNVLFGSVLQKTEISQSEKALIEASKADSVQSDIRDIVNQEAYKKAASSPHLAKQLVDYVSSNENTVYENATIVDPELELQRIKEAKESGEPINSGETPVIYKNQKGVL